MREEEINKMTKTTLKIVTCQIQSKVLLMEVVNWKLSIYSDSSRFSKSGCSLSEIKS